MNEPLDLDDTLGHITKTRAFPDGLGGDLAKTLGLLSQAHAELRESRAKLSRIEALTERWIIEDRTSDHRDAAEELAETLEGA